MPSQDALSGHGVPTRLLLLCGASAGPLFTVAWIVEGATRASYDSLRHPISSLALGEYGWMQAATFIGTGLLLLGFAFGLRRLLPGLGGSTWGPVLIGMMAIGLLGAGIFATDPMSGYPPGTPDLPPEPSVPGRLHRLFSVLVFLGLPIACFVFARLFARRGEPGWSTYSTATGIAFVAMFTLTSVGFAQVAGLAPYGGLLQRITLTLGWAWLTLLAVYFLRTESRPAQASADAT